MTDWLTLRRWSGKFLLTLVVFTLLAFAADSLLWHWHLAQGNGLATVQVSRMVVASLKGNREEYYMDGTEDTPCSRSLFPQGGNPACWWLARHRVVYER